MATKTKTTNEAKNEAGAKMKRVDLSTLAPKLEINVTDVWIVGDTPLICHAWSEKARREMILKQTGKPNPRGKEERDPEGDFVSSMYPMGEGAYGFPATAFKSAILSMAHKDKGLARSDAMKSIWLDHEMVRIMPGLGGAICDLPLVRLWGSPPEMREDMVRIGSGLNKTANMAFRAQFTLWAVRLRIKFVAPTTGEHLISLINGAGRSIGVGEWRNEKAGIFGGFHLGTPAEEKEWDRFARQGGPVPGSQFLAAAE